ncbi:hypothetical protein [Rhodococcus qingshengii]|uniref:hypothetical protein n=1 Tax=Rhodococcus qingshengii TaxID=334542 RepID=UPI0035DEF1CD
MNDLDAHVRDIIDGWTYGRYEKHGEHPEFQEDIDTIVDLIDDPAVGEYVLCAYLAFWSENGSESSVDVWQIPRQIQEHYRGHHDSMGEFVRHENYEYADRVKEKFLREYGNFINWEEKAKDYAGEYTFIEIPEQAGVYVFCS